MSLASMSHSDEPRGNASVESSVASLLSRSSISPELLAMRGRTGLIPNRDPVLVAIIVNRSLNRGKKEPLLVSHRSLRESLLVNSRLYKHRVSFRVFVNWRKHQPGKETTRVGEWRSRTFVSIMPDAILSLNHEHDDILGSLALPILSLSLSLFLVLLPADAGALV